MFLTQDGCEVFFAFGRANVPLPLLSIAREKVAVTTCVLYAWTAPVMVLSSGICPAPTNFIRR